MNTAPRRALPASTSPEPAKKSRRKLFTYKEEEEDKKGGSDDDVDKGKWPTSTHKRRLNISYLHVMIGNCWRIIKKIRLAMMMTKVSHLTISPESANKSRRKLYTYKEEDKSSDDDGDKGKSYSPGLWIF